MKHPFVKRLHLLELLLLLCITYHGQAQEQDCSHHKSGDVFASNDFSTIDRELDSIQSLYKGKRSCAISIVNEGPTELNNPHLYFKTGSITTFPPYSIKTGLASLNLFTKQSLSFRGTAGILSYDINGTDYKVAIMWNVPLNMLSNEVAYNMKIYPKHYATGSDMFTQMIKYAGKLNSNKYSNREEYGVTFRTTMTQNSHSKLIVWINTKDFDKYGYPHIHTACSYHVSWGLENYCWRECIHQGYCWTSTPCGGDQYCNQDMECNNDCVFS